MKYIIFDLETTCLQPEKAEIWQMAVKKVTLFDKTGEVENRVYKYKTVNPISYAARVRCNMTPEEIAKYNDFNLQEVLDVLELDNPDVYYVGHNVSFDRGILQGIIERNNMSDEYIDKSKLPNLYDDSKWICTMLLAQRLYNHIQVEDISGTNMMSFTLGYLYHYLHLYVNDEVLSFHDAGFDVKVTWELFKKEIKELHLNPLKQADEIAKLSNTPFILKYIPFGKYKGKEWKAIAATDPGWIKWCIKNMDVFDKTSPDYNPNIVLTVESL